MNAVKYWRLRVLVLLGVSAFLWEHSVKVIQAVENHNSSRSNKSVAVYPGPGSDKGEVTAKTVKQLLKDFDAMPEDRVNEKAVRELLAKYAVSEKVTKIVIEKGKGGLWRILLLQDPANEAKARTVAVAAENAAT